MKAPQIIMIVWFSLSLLVNARDHGKPKTGKDNFWATLLAVGLTAGVLIWGGFFGN